MNRKTGGLRSAVLLLTAAVMMMMTMAAAAEGSAFPDGIQWNRTKEAIRQKKNAGWQEAADLGSVLVYTGAELMGKTDGTVCCRFSGGRLVMADWSVYAPDRESYEDMKFDLMDAYGSAAVSEEKEVRTYHALIGSSVDWNAQQFVEKPMTWTMEDSTKILLFMLHASASARAEDGFVCVAYVSPDLRRAAGDLPGGRMSAAVGPDESAAADKNAAPAAPAPVPHQEKKTENRDGESAHTAANAEPRTVRVPIARAEAKNWITGKIRGDYEPANMIDGNEKTTWQFSTKKNRIGDTYVWFYFRNPVDVDGLWIKNGFWTVTNGHDQYTRNSRVRDLGIAFQYEGSTAWTDKSTYRLTDDERRMDWQKVSLGAHQKVTGIRFRILSIYRGTKFPRDVCISEVAFVNSR